MNLVIQLSIMDNKPVLFAKKIATSTSLFRTGRHAAILFLTAMTLIEVASTYQTGRLMKLQESSIMVVAESDTVLLTEVDKQEVKSINISEVVKKGDNEHRINLKLVPTSELFYDMKNETYTGEGTKIAAHLPLINEIYVYLNKGSELAYHICLGNGKSDNDTIIYVFDSEEDYINFITYGIKGSPAFAEAIPIGINEEEVCTDVTFQFVNNSYYFVVLLAPDGNLKFSYSVKATEKVVDIKQFTKPYPSCLLDAKEACTLSTNSSSFPDNQNSLTLLAYVIPNNDFKSKINHLELTFS